MSIPSATTTTVILNVGANDPYSLLNTVTGEITIKAPGYYAVNAGTWWDGEATPVTSSYRFVNVDVDEGGGYAIMSAGSTVRANNNVGHTVNSVSGVFGPFQTGYKLRMRAAQSSGELLVLKGGLGYTRLSICQLPGKVH